MAREIVCPESKVGGGDAFDATTVFWLGVEETEDFSREEFGDGDGHSRETFHEEGDGIVAKVLKGRTGLGGGRV